MPRRRLDAELVRRGLVASRSEAQEAVRAGIVTVAGSPATKAATLIAADQPLHLARPTRRFVSRGGEKLDAALARFRLDVAGLRCLDAGASTGGFTDRLLKGGAAHITAVDVGYGQFAWELRTDERVTLLERTNVRDLTVEHVPDAVDLVVADLSFISLRLAVPALVRVAASSATFVLLVKPQFEAGPSAVGRRGVVRDPAAWRAAIDQVATACRVFTVEPFGVMVSPITGPAGNVEFLLAARRGADAAAFDIDLALSEATS